MTHPPPARPAANFHGLGIAPKILAILDSLKFTVPTPIQHQAIPVAIAGKDMVGIAQTGTGKTLAFAVPMIQRLAGLKQQGLVVLPTRELALQVEEVFSQVGRTLGLRTAVLIGGTNIQPQIEQLRRKPHVIIGTPGRIADHLQQRTLQLGNVGIVVLDEGDRMLDMGFAPQIRRIMQHVSAERQTMLFSATMPHEIMAIAQQYLQLPVRIEIARSGTTAEHVIQEGFIVEKQRKLQLLETLLGQYRGTVLLFSRTKYGAKKICRAVVAMGQSVAEIHSNRSLNQRREALGGFKTGKYRVLVATDIASRGLDVTGIEVVINFDVPEQAEDYVHRIGRTARAGQPGRAITFVAPDQRGKVRDIEQLVKMALPISPLPALAPARASAPLSRHPPRGRGRHAHPLTRRNTW